MPKITDNHFSNILLGQTLNYRSILRKEEPERILYLAISYEIYTAYQKLPIHLQNSLDILKVHKSMLFSTLNNQHSLGAMPVVVTELAVRAASRREVRATPTQSYTHSGAIHELPLPENHSF